MFKYEAENSRNKNDERPVMNVSTEATPEADVTMVAIYFEDWKDVSEVDDIIFFTMNIFLYLSLS